MWVCVRVSVCALAAIAAGFHYASRQFQAAHLDYAHLSRVLCAAFAIFMSAHMCVCVCVCEWVCVWAECGMIFGFCLPTRLLTLLSAVAL